MVTAVPCLLLALALAANPTPVEATTASPPVAKAPATAAARPIEPAPALEPTAADPLEGSRHALSLGYDAVTFSSKVPSQYTFQSWTLGYSGSWGRQGLFTRLTATWPWWASQDGKTVTLGDYYASRYGLDALLGWQWRRTWSGAEAEAGPGLHLNLLKLAGGPAYQSFSAAQLGVGGQATLRWPTGWRLGGSLVDLGVTAGLALDVWDPHRDNDLRVGLAFNVALQATLGRR
jgi:hypothetical protein